MTGTISAPNLDETSTRSTRKSNTSDERRASMPLAQDRRAGVTILIASFVPVMVVVAALAIEVTNWAVVKLELQRASDVAALAGIINPSLAFFPPYTVTTTENP